MGYTEDRYIGTKSDMVQHRIQPWGDREHGSGECLAHCVKGMVLWTVWEITKPDGSKIRYIGCDKLGVRDGKRNNGRYGSVEGKWGYRDMCESMHPYYYSCPLKYLDMVPEVAHETWRRMVRQWHAERTVPKWAVSGMPVIMQDKLGWASGLEMTLTSVRPFKLEYRGSRVKAKIHYVDWEKTRERHEAVLERI